MNEQTIEGPIRSIIFWSALISVASVNFSVALSSITMGTAVGLWLIELARTRGNVFQPTPFDLLFILYLVTELAVAFFSQETVNSLINAKRLFLISFVYLSLYAIRSEAELRNAIYVLIGVGALTSFVELFSLSTARGHFLRLSMFQYFLTEGGIKMIILLLGLPFCLSTSAPVRVRVWIGCALVPLFIGLVLTQTRSSWLGFLAGLFIIGVRRYRWVLIGIVLLITLFILFAPGDYKMRAATIFDPTMTSNLTRLHMISTGWRMFLDRPLTGFGDVDLRKYYITYITPLNTAEGGHLHNNIMMLLVTLGVAGFTVVMTLFARIARRAWRAARETEKSWLAGSVALGGLAAFTGFQVNGLFEWNFGDHEIAVLFWFIVGLILVSQRLTDIATPEPAR